MLNQIKIGTEENYVVIKKDMSFYERKSYQNSLGGIVKTDRKASTLEFNTRTNYEDTADYFLLNSQIVTIVEDGKTVYDCEDRTQRREFKKVLNTVYGVTCKNLDEALVKIKEMNELIRTEEDEETEKND